MLPQADAVSPDCPGEEGLARLGRAFLTAAMGPCAFAVVPPARGPVGERPGRMGESGGPQPAVPWRPVLSQFSPRVRERPGLVPGWVKGGSARPPAQSRGKSRHVRCTLATRAVAVFAEGK